jgi:NADH:ubiquinone oxidoreductase subunit H
MSFVTYLIPIGLGAVALVLLAGLFNMLRGGSTSTSQKLMRWRVGLQFVTIIVVMLSLYIAGR